MNLENNEKEEDESSEDEYEGLERENVEAIAALKLEVEKNKQLEAQIRELTVR